MTPFVRNRTSNTKRFCPPHASGARAIRRALAPLDLASQSLWAMFRVTGFGGDLRNNQITGANFMGDRFETLEADLYKLRRDIEKRRGDDHDLVGGCRVAVLDGDLHMIEPGLGLVLPHVGFIARFLLGCLHFLPASLADGQLCLEPHCPFLWLNLQPAEFRLRGYLSRHSRSAFSTTSLLGSTRGKYSLSPVCKPTRIEK